MYRKTFVCLCRALNPIHTVFSTVHSISDIKNMPKFHDVWRIFTRIVAYTDEGSDRQTKSINIFQFFWKLLIMFKKRIIQLKTLLESFLDMEKKGIRYLLWDPVHEKLKQLIPFLYQMYFCTSEWLVLTLFSSIQTH